MSSKFSFTPIDTARGTASVSTVTFAVPSAICSLVLAVLAATAVAAPADGAGTQQQSLSNADESILLSPFSVTADRDLGYVAASTLAGTRLNTSLFQTPAAISVLTKELLDDLALTTTQDYLSFSTNAAHDPTSTSGNLVGQQSDAVVKIRGFTDSAITRDYFKYPGLNSDRFNVERIDASRGPNAVLYGIGGPGGVINIASKQAILNGRKKSLSFQLGSFDRRRTELDFNLPLLSNTLALRVNGLFEHRGGWSEFEYQRQKGGAVAATFKPFEATTVRVSWEGLDSRQNRALTFPAFDGGGTSWLASGAPLSGVVLPGTNPNAALLVSSNLQSILYSPQLRTQPFRPSTLGNADMRPDIAGLQTAGFWQTRTPTAAPVGVGVDDPYFGMLIPAHANLAGPGNRTLLNYDVLAVTVEQRLSRHLSAEIAASKLVADRRNFVPLSIPQLYGEANRVLPGAYYADGDATVAGGVSPGTLLPDVGATNPYAGGLYVQSTPSTVFQDWDNQYFRATLAGRFDLTERSPWLGAHTVAVMAQRDESYYLVRNQREYNATPRNSRPIDDAANAIHRRTYIDFSSADGVRGMIDPWTHPLPTDTGVNAAWFLTGTPALRSTAIDTQMAALQSAFLAERLVVTAGLRHDRQISDVASAGGERVPNSTSLWLSPHDAFVGTANRKEFSGDTRTVGLFLAPRPWLALTYNHSTSIQPQDTLDLLGRPLGTRSGQGHDIGVRLSLLSRRLFVNVNRYRSVDENRAFSEGLQVLANSYNPAMRAIVAALNQARLPLPSIFSENGATDLQPGGTSRDSASSRGSGVEIEVTGQLAPGWSLSANFSRADLRLADGAARANEFHRATQAAWDGNGTPLLTTSADLQTFVRQRDNTPNRDFVLNPATINDAYDWGTSLLQNLAASNGQAPLGHRRDSANLFTSYRFGASAPAWLQQARCGIGASFRGAPIVGYRTATDNSPYFGRRETLLNLMVGKRYRLRTPGHSLDLQLNLNNALGSEELMPYNATADGTVVRYLMPRVRRQWDLRATYSF